MRIGYDVTPLTMGTLERSGVGAYTANLLAYLRVQTEGNDEIIPLSPSLPNGRSAPPHRPHKAMNKTLWMQTVLPLQAAADHLDLCHFTNSVGSIVCPCPSILTIHDMTLWLYPEHHYSRRLLAMRPVIPLAVRRAAAIIAVSQTTKDDLVRILNVPSRKVHVIYEAPAPWFRRWSDAERAAWLPAARAHYHLPPRFLLYVGTIEPRKNLVRLLEAFARLRQRGEGTAANHVLLIAGQEGWKHEPVYAAAERLGLGSDAVRFLGYVSTPRLVALYNLADAFVFPSLYEGFGLPVVEAMACGAPVVTSRGSSLGEIAAGAAVLVDPGDVGSIEEGIRRVLQDESLRCDLITRGLARAADLTWADTAAQTRSLYGRALDRAVS